MIRKLAGTHLLASIALVSLPAAAYAQNEQLEEVTEQAQEIEEQAQEVRQEAQAIANDATTTTTTATTDPYVTENEAVERERDDDDFPWGLLGLLGLAGLLGLKGRDTRDVHIDARDGHPDTRRPL